MFDISEDIVLLYPNDFQSGKFCQDKANSKKNASAFLEKIKGQHKYAIYTF